MISKILYGVEKYTFLCHFDSFRA